MPAKRRSMEDLLAEQRAIEEPTAGNPRPGLASAGEPAPAPAVPLPALVAIPEPPHSPAGDGPLSVDERDHLAVCEAALDNLRQAFIAAGKALQVVRDGRLYRDHYATFEEYVEARWEMRRAYADKLIRAWPLAERLDPIGSKDLNEAQVRELLPIAQQHGQDAAALVYETVVEVDGVRVTAGVLHDVAAILPADHFDSDEAVAQIRAYLAGELAPTEAPPADRGQAFSAQTTRLVKALQREVRTDPGIVRKAVAELRAALDEIEREITA